MLEFKQIFQSYFHSKYTFEHFLNINLELSKNIKINSYLGANSISYIKNNNDSKILKKYHIFLNSMVFNSMDIHDCVYSYRNNRRLYDAVDVHKNNSFFYKTDIQKFFKHINEKMLRKCLQENINNYPACDMEKFFNQIINITIYKNSLHMGLSTSSAISNAVLLDFDKKISEYVRNYSIVYSRYSDDLIFSGNDYKEIEKLENIISELLKELYDDNFRLNKNKSIYFNKSNNINILGLTITPDNHITVNKYIKYNIKHLLYYLQNDKKKYKLFLEKRFNNNFNKVVGNLHYINDIDKNFIVHLREKYGNFLIDKIMHKGYNEDF